MNERTIFIEALEQDSPDRRAEFLDSACAGDTPLRQRVEALLASHEQASGFLAKPAPQLLADEFGGEPTTDAAESGSHAENEGHIELDFLAPADKPGSLGKLGHYDIQEVVGRGGMGIVLRAFDEKLHRVVAIKVMAAQLATSATARKRFAREAQAAAAVSHDHIVTIHAVEETGGLPYIAMQYVAGMSLEERIQRDGPLELNEILRIGMQTASGLAAAHAQGLIHRDIKPANILLENGVERVRITDFGLARVADDASLTQSGAVAGTPHYMAPEQARGDPLDARTDLFSLGSVLYAMCTGRCPFRASGSMAVLKRVCEETPTPIRESNPEMPDWLVSIIDKLHAKDPAERFQSAAEVAGLLSRHLAHVQHPSVAPLPTPVGNALRGVPRAGRNATEGVPYRSRRHWATAAIVLLCLGVGLGLSEATGTTQLTATVIRILTPNGTLIVETDDPGVKVTIEGDGGLIITGAGLEEIRLRPGSYRVQADRDGKPVPLDKNLVEVARGGRAIVKVKLEADNKPTPTTEKAFVMLGASGVAQRTFDTLADAVQGANDGDTIEIRGDGPFATEPIVINRSLVIRAGPGFRPIIKLSATMAGKPDLIAASAPLVVEGLELERSDSGDGAGGFTIFGLKGGPLYVINCRLVSAPMGAHVIARNGPAICELRNCELVTEKGPSAVWYSNDGRFVLDNCVLAGGGALACAPRPGQRKLSIRLARSTFLSSTVLSFSVLDAKSLLETKMESDPIDFELSANVFAGQDSIWLLGKVKNPLSHEEIAALAPRLPSLFARQERENLYAGNHRFLAPHPKKLAEWNQLWGQADASNQQGVVRFQGGDLFAKRTAGTELWLDDFRLRPDSAGYRAGSDGRDLGADVDLVGPGAAYERWKKTPEHQQWLKDTGQLRTEPPKPEPKAFVLLGSKGVPERRFDTLAEAVQRASDGDTIEIRGNGPFLSEPINIQRAALTIRAGSGFRPVIKLTPEALAQKVPLLKANKALVLEGLELHRAQSNLNRLAVQIVEAPLRAANCRFRATVWSGESRLHVFRNCEFLAVHPLENWRFNSHATTRVSFENCVSCTKWGTINSYVHEAVPRDVSIQVKRCTFVAGAQCFTFALANPSLAVDAAAPIRVEALESIFEVPSVVGFEQTQVFLDQAALLEPAAAEATLLRLIQWQGERNLFVPGGASIRWIAAEKLEPPHGPKDVDQWKRFWGAAEVGSLEGRVSFQGGGLLERTDLDDLTPDDFRLRPDSLGHGAGPDGKDLGADVDLVGPGAAYERWKKTPEYQQWLKETGQLRAETPQPEQKAFVVLGGKGIEVRKFDTLAEAVQGASDGDTIEIRGSGPFTTESIKTAHALTIRAGEGFRPVVRLSADGLMAHAPILVTDASLVLEGLEFQRLAPERKEGDPWRFGLKAATGLHIANCRFLVTNTETCLQTNAAVCELRNSEFLCSVWTSSVNSYDLQPGQRLVVENCLLTAGCEAAYRKAHARRASVQFTRNTFLTAPLWFYLWLDPVPNLEDVARDGKVEEVEASDNVFDGGFVVKFTQYQRGVLPVVEAEKTLAGLLDWKGERNLFPSDGPLIRLGVVNQGLQEPANPVKGLAAWRKFWGTPEANSTEGRVKYQGGDLLAKLRAAAERLTPDDFRLRPDSAGYQAGPDGKDLGADVDLVGPGSAYEKWKKTPEYQQWLKDTGQVK